MCHTKWCYGECDECIADKKREQEYEEVNASCPHISECILVTVDVKTDRCKTCGQIFTY